MIDGKPEWFRLSGAALADVILFDNAGKLAFIEAVCQMYDHALDPDYRPDSGEGFVGRAIDRQFDCFKNGIDSYMRLVNANPSGRPKGTQRVDNADPKRREQTKKEIEEEIENETKQELIRSGFNDNEISDALKTISSWDGIENRVGYLIQIMRNQRIQKKKNLAQRYSQRNYSGEDDDAMSRMLADMSRMEEKK
ncbi:MAG: hypothetical protein IKO25_09205 [Clostridia bacterium]|nr:hypothetical protein [Clostridia bacterium]